MINEFNRIKTIVYNLEKNIDSNGKMRLIEELIEQAEAYKKQLIETTNTKQLQSNGLDIKIEKITEETFLFKSVMVKNVYDGDYLERFSMIRTSDLKTSNVFEVHNKFWEAHEVYGGNIFATIPLALINDTQSSSLQRLNWDKVKVDVYEVKGEIEISNRGKIISTIEKMFDHYILVREVYGNILMILHYKL
ncbi:hypothetical protein [Alkaliphilus peptidifermentans]|uniref:Uncharacterized protein n=1 Tax=Alkaliphilus peptidifermentans DSM 18978 TaxID=1120976 RepID=A0A1G5KW28_9FIRM|nr:hypothetical protein [Alkaliphilus peptidifermentans]SCZ04883.1 hypothetical protein SAMN03080606_03831 [Alkaliphilus peptidifermentans DSM 18978]